VTAPAPARPLVLVADNEADILMLVRYRLERDGYGVVTAGDGEEALQVAREARPDLALLDVKMPRLDGYGVVQALRGDSVLADMPVIMLSASVKSTDVSRSYEAGADDHLGKPFSPDALVRCVERHLRRRDGGDG
jgi:DNA-binding response OmpR family regulator